MNISVIRSFLVGVLVLVAAVLAVWSYSFFNQRFGAEHTYRIVVLFDDAQGIGKQADVYLAGVKIGSVTSVGLSPATGKAEVRMEILKRIRIPKGSVAMISSSLLGGAATIDFTPPSHFGLLPPDAYYAPGAVITGRETPSLVGAETQAGDLMSQLGTTIKKANALLDQATKTSVTLNQMISDPRIRSGFADTVQNLDEASERGLELTQDLRTMLAQDNGQVQNSLANVSDTTAAIKHTALKNRSQLDQIVSNLNQTTAQIDRLTTQANETLAKGGTLQNLSDTIADLKQASIKMNEIEENIQDITGDKGVQSDIRQTIHSAAQASQNTSLLISRLTSLTEPRKPLTLGKGNLRFISRLDFSQNFSTNEFRTDFNLFAPLSETDFIRAGIYDLTERNDLNLQYGQAAPYNRLLTYRAGIYASKVGIGVDYDLFGGKTFSVDVYDPNRIRIDARQKFRLSDESSVWLGVEDVPRTNAVALGFQLQR